MMLSKRQRRLAAKAEEQTSKQYKFVEINPEHWRKPPPGMTRCFRNHKYIVMIFDDTMTTHGKCIKALIQSHYDKRIENHWSTIQAIKNEVFGPETMAIEYYPKESELIDLHNIYWIWIFPDGVIPRMIVPQKNDL